MFMYYWMNSGNIHVYISIHTFLIHALLGNFEVTEDVTLHCGKVGGGVDQGPATEVTHLG